MALHRVFIGYDPRQPLAYNVCQYSIVRRSSEPVSVTPLIIEQLPTERRGLTPFTFSRFLVPWICDYQGWALFMDCDVVVMDDIAKLFRLADDRYAVMVVKNPRTYEWASVMLFNCARCRVLTPDFVNDPKSVPLDLAAWAGKDGVGALPAEWNHLVGYDAPRDRASLAHYTQGVPIFPEVQGCEFEVEWFRDYREMNKVETWQNIMGGSVHAATVGDKRVAKLSLPDKGQSIEAAQALRRRLDATRPPRFDPAYSRASPSPRYRELVEQYRQMHKTGDEATGVDAATIFNGKRILVHLDNLRKFKDKHGARTMLDYGSGKGAAHRQPFETTDGRHFENAQAFLGLERFAFYDPGFDDNAALPEGPFDGVVCLDVLEHIAEDDIGWVVDEIFGYADRFVYAVAASYPATKHLPNGENCHVTIRPPEWWAAVFAAAARKRPEVRWQLGVEFKREGTENEYDAVHFTG